MRYVTSKEIKNFLGQEVCLRGWVRNQRKASSKLRFVVFRDGLGEVQAVASKPDMGEDAFEVVKSFSLEASVELTGVPEKHPKYEDEVEFHLTGAKLLGKSEDFPIGKKEHGADFLLSHRHLWLRSRKQVAMQKIRHTIYFGICNYLNSLDYFRFDSPILTPNACEGTTTLFELPYFDQGSAYLSQSGQLYLEAGIMALGRVYDFGPVFRAEKSKTRKHLTEFWMMDAEAAFVEHCQSMDIQEGLIKAVIGDVLQNNAKELEILESDPERLKAACGDFLRITHRQAIDILKSKGFDVGYEDDFGAKEEAAITEGSVVPVFIEKWPASIKSFYMKQDPENPELVLGSDLLAPGGFGEIIGGSEREVDYEKLKAKMEAENMSMDDYGWYLDLRKYGSVPHSGFGIGLERFVAWVCGTSHIRETIPFPRMIYRLHP